MTKTKPTKYRYTENKPLAQAMHGLRSSSAASPHTPSKYKGSRTANKRRAIQDYR